MMKKAFTMTEALIIIGIVGILAVLSIVAVSAAKPDKDVILFRKSYMTTQKVIKELLSDKDLYPSSEVIALNFDSTKSIKSMATQVPQLPRPDGGTTVLPGPSCNVADRRQCRSWGGTWVPSSCACIMPEETEFDFTKNEISVIGKGFADTDISAEQRQKFPFLRNVNVSASNKFAVSFANRVNTIAAPLISANTVRFGTPDGIVFSIEDHFNDSGKYADITVYLKKVDWSDNSGIGERLTRLSNETCSYNASTCKAPTKFLLRVEANGKVKLLNASNTSKIDAMACSYLRYPKINKRSKIPTSSTVNTCFAN